MRFWISDTHFGHANIISHCNRPFADVNEMDAAMISNWNRVVGKDDDVIHLGDFCLDYKLAKQYLSQLNGRVILVLGNHDGSLQQMTESGFFKVYQDFMFVLSGRKCFAMHRPKPLTGYNTGKWIVHGHVHDKAPKVDKSNKMINLSVEQWGYTPVAEAELVKLMR